MKFIIEDIFWISCFVIFWAYFGYYLFLKLLSLFSVRQTGKTEYTPDVSLIITAHNEERRIEDKIKNTLALNYPKEKLQIVYIPEVH